MNNMESKDFRIVPIITNDINNSVKIELRKRLGSIEEAQAFVNKIVHRFNAYETSIHWSVEDFETKAKEIAEDKGAPAEELFDFDLFGRALVEMIENHDCNFGITWHDVVDSLESCKR